ncbi:MAG: hypothetical protein ACREBU_09350 [Nitrososphaera sp.]
MNVGEEGKLTWLDAAYKYEVSSSSDVSLALVESYGKIIQITDGAVWIAHEVMDEASDSAFRGVTVIPRVWVKEWQTL